MPLTHSFLALSTSLSLTNPLAVLLSLSTDQGSLENDLLVNRSITEWETKLMLRDTENFSRFQWVFRNFVGGSDGLPQSVVKKLFDNGDAEKAVKLEKFLTWINQRLAQGTEDPDMVAQRVKEMQISAASYEAGEQACVEYLAEWKAFMMNMLEQELLAVAETRKYWKLNSCGLGIPGEAVTLELH